MSQDEYFRFVQALAEDLNGDNIKLPSFPDVVMQIRSALDDPDTTGQDLAAILGNEPVLASRILILANSNYHNPAGIKIESLDAAVGRVGFEKIRTTAIAHAVEQLHSAEGLEPLRAELKETWSVGLKLGALSEVIAKHCTKLDADSAFIAGLLNRIGVLYIFTKYHEYPSLLQDNDSRENLIDEWAAPIGESIVQNWKFSEEIRATLNPDEVETTRRRSEPNLADIVTTAKRFLNGDEITSDEKQEVRRLQLKAEQVPKILESFKEKLDSLSAAVA